MAPYIFGQEVVLTPAPQVQTPNIASSHGNRIGTSMLPFALHELLSLALTARAIFIAAGVRVHSLRLRVDYSTTWSWFYLSWDGWNDNKFRLGRGPASHATGCELPHRCCTCVVWLGASAPVASYISPAAGVVWRGESPPIASRAVQLCALLRVL